MDIYSHGGIWSLILICVGKTQHNETGNGDHRFHASVRSRRRRIVLGKERGFRQPALITQRRAKKITNLRTVAAAVVDTVHAPPAMTFLHAEQFQMPTACRFTLSCKEENLTRAASGHVRKKKKRNPAAVFTCLAAECAGVPCVLGNFHLEGSRAKSVFSIMSLSFLFAPF